MTNIHELALKKKVRFKSAGGNYTLEDLYDLDLVPLNDMAMDIDKQLREITGQKSFIDSKSKTDKLLELKLELLKAIIATKIAERDKKAAAVTRKEKRDRIINQLALKEEEKFAGQSATKLKQDLAKLDDEEDEEDEDF